MGNSEVCLTYHKRLTKGSGSSFISLIVYMRMDGDRNFVYNGYMKPDWSNIVDHGS